MFTLSFFNFFDFYYQFFYSIQKYIYNIFFSFNQFNNTYSFIFIFLLGVLTILTPCLISILPISLSYINSQENYSLNIFAFAVGVFTSFVSLIALTNFFSLSFLVYQLPLFSYSILILISLNLMNVLDFPDSSIILYKYLNKVPLNNKLIQSYIIGFIISSSTLPCNTSCLLIFTFLLQNTNSPLHFLIDLCIYFFGCIIPLLLVLKINFDYVNISILSYFWNLLFPISGSFLFVFSCFSLLKIIFI